MAVLSKASRNKLENSVKKARIVAEKAARTELERLGVGEAAAPAYLSTEEKDLRRRLRAHGRQLGDKRLDQDRQELVALAAELGYEHWHRMLFARFLADNGFLLHPEHRVALSLSDCAELAKEEARQGAQAATRWDLAARYASAILPQIFRADSPVLEVILAPDERQALEAILDELPPEVFSADDSLGWVYQFWQAEAKDAVNKSNAKVGAAELPAVTQLFTEDYMVAFLLDNSLGAWWAAKRLAADPALAGDAGLDEAALRARLAPPGLNFSYLRLVRGDDGLWHPAAGDYTEWPRSARELRYLDPCCGSGHFLTAGYRYLTAFRMVEEGLDASAAGDAVLRDNLFGLELDPRCVEIAAFSLAFEAWRSGGLWRELPALRVACSGLAPRTGKAEWLRLADRAAGLLVGEEASLIPDPNATSNWKSELHSGLEALYALFQDAPVLGSLIDPASVTGDLFKAGFDRTAELLAEALRKERSRDEGHEAGVAAQGIAEAAGFLSGRYHLVATNVPYLARGKQDETLRDFCADYYDEAKNDLATVFLDRCLDLCHPGGSASIVLPQNWLFLTSYKKFREKLLKRDRWQMLARLGPKAFQTPMWDFNVLLITISAGQRRRQARMEPLVGSAWRFAGLDAAAPRDPAEKARLLREGEVNKWLQMSQLGNPDYRLVISSNDSVSAILLNKFAQTYQGIGTSDNAQFLFRFWEHFTIVQGKWKWVHTAAESTGFYGGNCFVLLWENGRGRYYNHAQALKSEGRLGGWKSGAEAWGKCGLTINVTRKPLVNIYLGNMFDTTTAVLVCEKKHLATVYSFISNPCYEEALREIDQALSVTEHTLIKVPFQADYWRVIAISQYPHGLPAPFSDDPTQWLFHGHPCGSVVWDEGIKRLAFGAARKDATVLQVALARLLGYRWPAELDETMELSTESRALVKKSAELLTFADEDGIVCIPSVNRERPAADRLLDLLAAAYGSDWSGQTLYQLLAACDAEGKDLETWLRDSFFEQHCKLFGHRPFIWQIWDGLKGGFSALVNYHRLDRATLEKLIYVYLGGWIHTQEEELRANRRGAAERLAAARELKLKLERILEGEAPYDIFVRWKSLAEQPMGWDPDLNDGVRLNIRPFMSAGVLRHNKPPKLNVKWDVDRGSDVQSAPWYPVFKGKRVNDHHTSLAEKRKAREE